jgi:hypothetical protein
MQPSRPLGADLRLLTDALDILKLPNAPDHTIKDQIAEFGVESFLSKKVGILCVSDTVRTSTLIGKNKSDSIYANLRAY